MPKTTHTINRAPLDSGRFDALFTPDGEYVGDLTAPRGTPEYDEQIAAKLAAHAEADAAE